jgi:hypothetical protein
VSVADGIMVYVMEINDHIDRRFNGLSISHNYIGLTSVSNCVGLLGPSGLQMLDLRDNCLLLSHSDKSKNAPCPRNGIHSFSKCIFSLISYLKQSTLIVLSSEM